MDKLRAYSNVYELVFFVQTRAGFAAHVDVSITQNPLSRCDISGEPFPKEISWYKKTGQIFKGLHNGTIENYNYTIGYYGDMHLQRPDKSSSGFYKIQVCRSIFFAPKISC